MVTQIDLQNCLQWAQDNGAFIDPKISFKITEDAGVTAFANEKFSPRPDQALIRVPETLLITSQQALSEFSGAVNERTLLNSVTQLYLSKLKFGSDAVHLKPFYKPYLDVLPLHLPQPYFWSTDEVMNLRGTDVYLTMRDTLNKLVRDWRELFQVLSIEHSVQDKQFLSLFQGSGVSAVVPLEQFCAHINSCKLEASEWNSFIGYLWSYCIFNSRAFPRIILNRAGTDSTNLNEGFLYPIVDLLNHKNDVPVRWEMNEHNELCFMSQSATFSAQEELFNNYGNISNEKCLLNYGFWDSSNKYDFSRLTLKLPSTLLNDLPIDLNKSGNFVSDDGDTNILQFSLKLSEPLPSSLLALFAYLSKLKSEESPTVRSVLEGIDQLTSVVSQRLLFYKNFKIITSSTQKLRLPTIKLIKLYYQDNKKILNATIEKLSVLQKKIFNANKEFSLSFKTIFKNDKIFANSLLLIFGAINYEDLITKDCLNDALLLWIVKSINDKSNKQDSFIKQAFREVSDSIVIEKEDVMEFLPFYKKYFPNLSERIPEIYSVGDWGIRQFIVADTAIDRLVWIRKSNKEPIFLMKKTYDLQV
ncbi:protein-lysine N-methyltransferase [Saccharomyces paradoxus]|uniref:Protein-lysine N-methyltransferase n=1 Tax=Saccharomyces paradoxus TaxID=27291 RepID=A0A8B8US89_SACPA|nr:Efm1 [Saccharomyces paradoxus]QHS73600.1 Efm1 [Saccharomyces paradoxus]